MAHARTILLCACAIVAVIAIPAAPAPPTRNDNKESKMVQENAIVVRRIPTAYFYPFSLWPLPKLPARDPDDSLESYPLRSYRNIRIRQNKR